jgi:uncharacterized glyoxalase superfamily protein PhnB
VADWRPTLMSAVVYRDPKAAIRFLEDAFGFELFMLLEDADGNLVHSEMRLGGSVIMVGYEWSDEYKSPTSIGGKVTQALHIGVDKDIDGHCEHVRNAGFVILAEPETQFYGDRTYRCRDPEGHIWTVSQTVREVSREEAEAASGLKITGWI